MPVEGGETGCQKMFEQLVARDFGNVLYFRSHRMLVDTYALQHPESYCASPKSLAAHLTGLCWLLERGGSRAVVRSRIDNDHFTGPRQSADAIANLTRFVQRGDDHRERCSCRHVPNVNERRWLRGRRPRSGRRCATW